MYATIARHYRALLHEIKLCMTTFPLEPSAKRALRATMRARRDALERREERSAAICARLVATEIYQRATAIHCYLPIRSEVDTLAIVQHAFAAGKRVAVPVVVPDALQLSHEWLQPDALETLVGGVFGTWQPVGGDICDPALCDLFVVPLLAFDRSCRRLGYGKGHYDRLLEERTTATIGVAFAAQEVAALPAEPHDVPLTAIVTEDELIERGSGDLRT